MAEANDLVWYAAYGSNLLYERFMAYIEGGVPKGSNREHWACSDTTPPRAICPCRIPHRLYFAREARSWGGGGVAFIRPEPEPDASSLGRRYLVTTAQLVEILEQENNLARGALSAEVPEEVLREGEAGRRLQVQNGWYDLLLCLGRAPAGDPGSPEVPVWTFTGSRDLSADPQPPHNAYLGTLGLGLLETYWSAPDAAKDFKDFGDLKRYLLDALPKDEDRERPAAALRDSKRRFVKEWFQDCPGLIVDRTRNRQGTGRSFVAQLHREDRRHLGIRRRLFGWLPTYAVVESRHPRRRVAIRVLLHEPRDPNEKPQKGTVRLDQKVRQALGVTAGDRVDVRKPRSDERRLRDGRSLPARVFHRLFQLVGGYQPQLMRVTLARYEEMEIPVCRIPSTSFEVLGLESGDFVVVESSTRRKSLRALAATDTILRQRDRDFTASPIVKNCKDELTLDRTPVPGQDLPLLFIDFDARQEIGVDQCDPVYVYRDVVQLLWKELRVLGLTVIVSASIVVFQLGLDVPLQLSIFGAAVAVGLALVLLRIRKRIG